MINIKKSFDNFFKSIEESSPNLKKTLREISPLTFFLNIKGHQDIYITINGENSYINFNENIYDKINSNLINYYSTPYFLISLINYINQNELSVSKTTVDDLLVNLINNKHYIKQDFIRDNLNMIIELFFYKHINITKKLSFKAKEYYYSKLSNVKKFNLDYETFFLEFKDKLLSE